MQWQIRNAPTTGKAILFLRTNRVFQTAQFYSQGIAVRAEKFIQKGWKGCCGNHRDHWFVVFALEYGIVGRFLGQDVGIVGS